MPKSETEQVRKNVLFLYTHFTFIATRDCVSFSLTDPVHQLCCPRHIAIATYINIYRTFIHTYTPSQNTVRAQTRLSHNWGPLRCHFKMIAGLSYTGLSLALAWPWAPVPQRGVRVMQGDSIFRLRWPHFGDHKRVEIGGARLSRRWHVGSHRFHHVDPKHSGAPV